MVNSSKEKPVERFLLWVSKKLRRYPPGIQQAAAFVISRYYFFAIFLALSISVTSYWDILPGIFQDEYIYSMEARKIPLADQAYPNYLFSLLFEVTNLCGTAFYSCGKLINTGLLIAMLTIFFFIARNFQSEKVSALLTAIVALSPITSYASFFMPEMLFYTLNLLAILLLLKAINKKSILWWFGFSAVVGLAMLTKRHELFFMPGFGLAISFLLRNRAKDFLSAIGFGVAFGFLVPVIFRQVVVFALTGVPWAALLGSTYARSFAESTRDGGARQEALPSIFDLLSQGSWHLVFHISLVMVLGLALTRWSTMRAPKIAIAQGDNLSMLRSLAVIALSLSVSIIPVVTFFESYLSLTGDSHAFRLLGRYYEFLFPILLLLSSKVLDNESINRNRRVWMWLFVPSYLIFVFLIGPFIQTGPSDSATFHGLKLIGPLLLVFLLAGVWSLISTKNSKQLGMRPFIIALLVPLLTLSAGLASKADLRSTIGTQYSFYDVAGLFFGERFPEVQGTQVMVVGASRTEVVATKFSIDKPEIRHSIQPFQAKKVATEKLKGIRYVIVLYPTALITEASVELIVEQPGFRIYEVSG